MKKTDLEMLIGTLSVAAIALFFIMITVAMISSCAHIRLPDRDHPLCKVPWENRKTCLDASDCPEEFACARRGRSIGKCTYIDCCEPWRHGPRLLGADWCRDLQISEDK